MFCNALGAPERAMLRSWRSLRAASGSFSISASASPLIETAIQEKPPITIASTSAAPMLRGTRHAWSQFTIGCSA
jgi:hypothetical protein